MFVIQLFDGSSNPFAWILPSCLTGCVDKLDVAHQYRGQRLGRDPLPHAPPQMRAANVCCAEAHVDASNYTSLQACVGAD